MKYACSGVILAGGLNTRFSGKNKAMVRVGGKRIIDYIYGVFNELFEEIILVTNNPIKYLDMKVSIVSDLIPIRSSLTGIHAGLFYSSNPYVFFAACDTPFLKKELVETILEKIEPGFDLIIPEISAGLEPLCAIYSKNCLKRIEQHLLQNKFKIQQVFKKDRIKKIHERLLREKDPELLSFFNINCPEDLKKAEVFIPRFNKQLNNRSLKKVASTAAE